MRAFKTLLAVALVLGISGILYAQDPGMMGTGKGKQFHKPSETGGAKIFNANCSRCHPDGGNVVVPILPLRGSSKLADFKTFLSFIRDPKMPDGSEGVMPAFSQTQLSDRAARRLYQYITSAGASGKIGGDATGGYGIGQGMMGGGMMGGYGMGQGMMGGGHDGWLWHGTGHDGPRYDARLQSERGMPEVS